MAFIKELTVLMSVKLILQRGRCLNDTLSEFVVGVKMPLTCNWTERPRAPHIKWILSFSDGCQSGDGTIYRATGFVLTKIKENNTIWELPDKSKITDIQWKNTKTQKGIISRVTMIKGANSIKSNGGASMKPLINIGAKKLEGFQLRYIYLIDKTCKITVPILPFSKIDEMGAGMYKGEKITVKERQEENK